MGVVYRLLPEIKEFIIEEKQKNPRLGCRKLTLLIESKFNVKISKSSVNSLIKKAGLSSPVGRRRKRLRGKVEADGLGALLLKSVDLIMGGTAAINKVIKSRFPKLEDSSLTEGLLYLPLFRPSQSEEIAAASGLWPLIGKKYSHREILSYLTDLQGVISLPHEILQTVLETFKLIRCIEANLSNNHRLYLDGQLRTVWSSQNIPDDFASTLYKTSSYINSFLNENSPLILLAAPGYEAPREEFLDFLLALETGGQKLAKFTLLGNNREEIESIENTNYEKKDYMFGLWPWQFEKHQQVQIRSEFSHLYLEHQKKDFYIAEAEIVLTQLTVKQAVTLRGCALKRSLSGKIILLICTNMSKEIFSTEAIVRAYLNRWPNLEEGFIDFSRKIAQFTHAPCSAQGCFAEGLVLEEAKQGEIRGILDYYLSYLDQFLRCRIFPLGYEKVSFSTMKERFYQLKARIKTKKDYQIISFILPKEYAFQKDLAYACQRLNEYEITTFDKKNLWFDLG